MYELDDKRFLLLLLFIPILFIIYFLFSAIKKKKLDNFVSKNLFPKIIPEYSENKLFLKFFIWSFILLFLSISLVNPKVGSKIETVKRKGIDVIFALDVSKSMLTEDIKPSRFLKAKQLISSTINIFQGDRIGIIAYAGAAYPLLPITTDYTSAKMFLNNTDTDIVPSQGTAISEALEMAVKFFDKEETKGKLLIIISDGEDHEGDFSSQIEEVKSKDILIYTIGIGTENGAPIPVKENGNLIGYKKDNNQNIVISKRDEQKLIRLANATNGVYIDGNNSTKEIVKSIQDNINKIEKTEYDSKKISDFKDQFQWFLTIALILLVLDIFIFEKKTKWLKNLNLFKDKN